MTLQQILNVIEDNQGVCIEMVNTSILGIPLGRFYTCNTKFDDNLKDYYSYPILSVSVGPKEKIWIKI